MERQFAAGDGWRVLVLSLARVVLVCRALGGVVCDGFEGCSNAGVVHEWGERRAGGSEPVGVEGLVLVGFDVEEVRATDGEAAVFVGELDHGLGRVGGVRYGDLGGVAVFVGNHVAFLELAECGPFPGAARPVGNVLAAARCACGIPVPGVVCSCHYVPLFPLVFLLARRATRGGLSADG